jgi:hypothetical protein
MAPVERVQNPVGSKPCWLDHVVRPNSLLAPLAIHLRRHQAVEATKSDTSKCQIPDDHFGSRIGGTDGLWHFPASYRTRLYGTGDVF